MSVKIHCIFLFYRINNSHFYNSTNLLFTQNFVSEFWVASKKTKKIACFEAIDFQLVFVWNPLVIYCVLTKINKVFTSNIEHASEIIFRTVHFVLVFFLKRNPIKFIARTVNFLSDKSFVEIRRLRLEEWNFCAVSTNVAPTTDGIRRWYERKDKNNWKHKIGKLIKFCSIRSLFRRVKCSHLSMVNFIFPYQQMKLQQE